MIKLSHSQTLLLSLPDFGSKRMKTTAKKNSRNEYAFWKKLPCLVKKISSESVMFLVKWVDANLLFMLTSN